MKNVPPNVTPSQKSPAREHGARTRPGWRPHGLHTAEGPAPGLPNNSRGNEFSMWERQAPVCAALGRGARAAPAEGVGSSVSLLGVRRAHLGRRPPSPRARTAQPRPCLRPCPLPPRPSRSLSPSPSGKQLGAGCHVRTTRQNLAVLRPYKHLPL